MADAPRRRGIICWDDSSSLLRNTDAFSCTTFAATPRLLCGHVDSHGDHAGFIKLFNHALPPRLNCESKVHAKYFSADGELSSPPSWVCGCFSCKRNVSSTFFNAFYVGLFAWFVYLKKPNNIYKLFFFFNDLSQTILLTPLESPA